MEARSTDKKTLQFLDNGKELGQLVYENVFSLKAKIQLANEELYCLNPVGFWGTSIVVTKNEMEIANLKMNWRGQIVFSFQDGQEFMLKAKGVFYNKYLLQNKNEEALILFTPKFNWSKFDYNYDITFEQDPQDMLLVLLGVYAANYFIASMSGAMSGMA